MRDKYFKVVRNSVGNILPSATVTVYLAGSTTLASVYASVTSATAVNSVTSDTNGVAEFYVDRFDYDSDQTFKLVITKTGYTTATYDNVVVDNTVLITYTISADKTVSTHITVPKGVVYSVASGKTLTFSGSLSAGPYQIFSGSGTVTGLKEIDAAWFGADPSASAATNTAAIQSSATAISSGASWRLQIGTYSINDAITFPDLAYNKLYFDGVLSQTDNTKGAVIFGAIQYWSDIYGLNVTAGTFDDWASSRAGVLFNGNTEYANIYVSQVKGFEKGLHFSTTGYFLLNNFHLMNIRNNKYGVYVGTAGTAGNFFNANQFYGGYFVNDNKATTTGSTAYYFTNGNHYRNSICFPTLEDLHIGFHFYNCYGFGVFHPYTEDVDTLGEFSANVNMTWIHGGSGTEFPSETFTQDANSRRNVYLGTAQAADTTYPVAIFDVAGIGFEEYGKSNTIFTGRTYKDSYGVTQTLNKQYSGAAASAVPTSGTFNVGAIAWNTLNIVSGQPMGHICKTIGTMDTITGVTGSTTTGSTQMTVNDASSLKVGMYVQLAKDGGGQNFAGYAITAISGTTVTMATTAAGDSTAGSAVTAYNATWQALANYP